jgi:PilZ domain
VSFPRFSPLPIADRRKSPREPRNQIVRLKFDSSSWHRGMLENLSAGGACVLISTEIEIPPEFVIVLPPNTSRPCRLVWQQGQKIGIEFLNS